MQASLLSALPAAARASAARAWSRWAFRLPSLSFGNQRHLTAIMLGERCVVVRLEANRQGLRLAAADEGTVTDLPRWKPLFRGSRGLLVLRTEDRFLLTLDKPQVPEADVNLAVRWPMGEALGAEAEQLLTTALPLPRVNEALRPQVLGIAARLEAVQEQLGVLRQAGIDVRSIDIIDSALRGMALLQPDISDSTVAVALMGNSMSIGLVQSSQICALRSVPLPERQGHADAELAEQLALNTRRTFDHYERQALLTLRAPEGPGAGGMAIGRALASVASLSQAALETFCSALPDAPRLFDLAAVMACDDAVRKRCVGHDELTALACVAAARLFDTGAATRPQPAASQEVAASAPTPPPALPTESPTEEMAA